MAREFVVFGVWWLLIDDAYATNGQESTDVYTSGHNHSRPVILHQPPRQMPCFAD
jgi:hypothetical protein